MIENTLPDSTIYRLVGYVLPDAPPPNFIIPVLVNLETDEAAIQEVSTSSCIQRFINLTGPWGSLDKKSEMFKRVGDSALVGLQTAAGEIIIAEATDLLDHFKVLVNSNSLSKLPAFAHTIAKIVGDSTKAEQTKRTLFGLTVGRFTRTSKFFLENNVVREELLRGLSEEHHPIINSMKIDIRGSQIKVKLGDNVSSELRDRVARTVTNVVKSYSKLPEVEFSFSETDSKSDILEREISKIRSGTVAYDKLILDSDKNWGRIPNRQAGVLIPEVSLPWYTTAMNKADSLRSILPSRSLISPLSRVTAQKIVELEPISLVSALLFRIWVFGDVSQARTLPKLQLHICRFKARGSKLDLVRERLTQNDILAGSANHIGLVAFPLSFLLFFIERSVFTRDEVAEIFVRTGSPNFFPYYFNWLFLRDWVKYSVFEYPHIQRSITDDLHTELGRLRRN